MNHLQIVSATLIVGGASVLQSDGTIAYSSGGSANGQPNPTINYVLTDGVTTISGVVSIEIVTISSNAYDLNVKYSAAGSYQASWLDGGGGQDTITGADAPDQLIGGSQDDTLLGGAGSDILRGGQGNDTLDGEGDSDHVDLIDLSDGSGGVTMTFVNGGTGSVSASGLGTDNYVRMEGVIGTSGGDAIDGSNVVSANDYFYGGGGVDTLRGFLGDDYLSGGTGNDILNGGAGFDKFVFDTLLTGTGSDTIQDFNANATDKIALDDAIFTGFAGQNTLSVAQFNLNTAVGTGAQLIFNTATGALIYDSNGTASGGTTQIATLTLGGISGTVDVTDFVVI